MSRHDCGSLKHERPFGHEICMKAEAAKKVKDSYLKEGKDPVVLSQSICYMLPPRLSSSTIDCRKHSLSIA
jgi:hypothetical protein